MSEHTRYRITLAKKLAALEGLRAEDSVNGWVRFYRAEEWVMSLRITDIEERLLDHGLTFYDFVKAMRKERPA